MTSRLIEAFALAAEFHATDVRKMTNIPYISHLMSVSALVMEYGGDEDQAIAALLHDAVEDAADAEEALRRQELIRSFFGDRVAAIVQGCTDGTPDAGGVKGDWHARKRSYLAHLATAPQATLLVSCADKLHNARAILGDLRTIGPAVFARFNAGREGTLWYYDQLVKIFCEALPGPPSQELERTVAALLSEAARV